RDQRRLRTWPASQRRLTRPPNGAGSIGFARAAMGHPFDALTLDELRRRRSEKWSALPPDILPVWVAERGFPLAEPIRAALADAVGRSDTGYAYARGPELPESFAAFAAARYGLETDPSRMFVLEDIMRGILVSALLFTDPGDGIAITPPVYPPFFST